MTKHKEKFMKSYSFEINLDLRVTDLACSQKSKSFIFYSGFILFWGILCSILTGFGRYQFIDSSYFSNEGLVFSITIMFIFLLLFIKNFLRLEKKLPWNEKLVNINLGILITYFSLSLHP